MTTYANPFHQNGHGPARYVTDRAPIKYRGTLIYQRVPGCFDVVENGTCLTQRAGLKGAMKAVDVMLDDAFRPEAQDVRSRRISARQLAAQQVAA